jgi:branched-chain amino acid transport system permease protein
MRAHLSTLVILAAIILLIAAIGALGGAVIQRVAADMLIKLVVVLGLSVFIGNSGVLSFGHASFAALGAYSAAWFTLPLTAKKIFLPKLPAFVLATQFGLPAGAAIGVVFASFFALIVGIVVVRLSGIAASIATLAWLAIVNTVLANADSLTKGTSSLVGLPLVVGVKTAALSALLALLVAYLFKFSRHGLMLRASREDEAAALASGIPVRSARLYAFVVSAALVALGGILQGHFLGVLTVSQFYFEFTFLTLAMLVMGGMRSISGAVVGTVVVGLVAEALRVAASGFTVGDLVVPAAPGIREIGLALIMLAVLMARPRGIMGDRELRLPVH